jgi:hypothetical protein
MMGTAQAWQAIADDDIKGAGPIDQHQRAYRQLAVPSPLTDSRWVSPNLINVTT